MRILCLVDFQLGSSRWIWDFIPGVEDQVEFLCASLNRGLMRRCKPLAYFYAYTVLALKAHMRVRKGGYDLVVAWEGKNGFFFALLRRLLRQRYPKMAILAFALRGWPFRSARVARFAMRDVDLITVPTSHELRSYSEYLQIPPERFRHCVNGTRDIVQGEPISRGPSFATGGEESIPLVFAGGYSHRDFATFVESVCGLRARVLIVAPRSRDLCRRLPDNVEWLDTVPPHVYRTKMLGASIVVVPLEEVRFAVGLMEILSAMAAGKAIVATRTFATQEYLEPDRTGLLVKPGDPIELNEAIRNLLEYPDKAACLGANARDAYLTRYTFAAFAIQTYCALHALDNLHSI